MYSAAILGTYADRAELVGICDINADRMDYYLREWQKQYGKGGDIPTYDPSQFELMLSENQVDTVIVTTMDRTHHRYIIRAMHAGCDAITEKPMTVDEKKCQQILDAIEETGKSLRVTFNYRYAPRASKVKELIMNGTIGEVKSVHFEWLLDTIHGADYFRRWHRNKNNSGGLMVHKATHHFDCAQYATTFFHCGVLLAHPAMCCTAKTATDSPLLRCLATLCSGELVDRQQACDGHGYGRPRFLRS
jgi:predicted dehydrogenase